MLIIPLEFCVWSCFSDLAVSGLRTQGFQGLNPGRVKPKKLKLVFSASPLGTQHLTSKSKD